MKYSLPFLNWSSELLINAFGHGALCCQIFFVVVRGVDNKKFLLHVAMYSYM